MGIGTSGCAAWSVAAVLALSGCGWFDDDDPAPTAVGGSGELAPEPPPPPSVRTLPAERLARALKSHPRPALGYPQENLFALRPAGPGGLQGELYASSSLIHGGEGVVSRLQTRLSAGPFVSLEYFVSSGVDSWYVANGELVVAQGEPLRFEGTRLLRRDAPVPIDQPLHEWRLDTPAGPATLMLSVESVDGEPEAFAVCWRTRAPAPVPVDRSTCTVHASAIAARVTVRDAAGAAVVTDTGPVPSPWNPSPPDGTPAPAPDPLPIRTIRGDMLSAALRRPAYATPEATGAPLPDPLYSTPADPPWSVRLLLRSPEVPGSIAALSASLALSPLGNPYGSWDLRIATTIDGARAAMVDARIDVLRYGGQLGPVGATVAGATLDVVDPGPFGLSAGDHYPLDRTIGAWGGAGLALQLVLQSAGEAGAGGLQAQQRGYRVCWRTLSPTIDRLACGVHEVEGETARVVDVTAGRIATYRR